MGIDLDLLDDIFAGEEVKNARAGCKFKPKPKFGPAKRGLAAASVSSSQAGQTSEFAESESTKPVKPANPSEQCSDVVPNDNGGCQASMDKSVGENADIFIGLEALEDLPPHTNTDMEGAVTMDSTHTTKLAEVPTCSELSKDLDPLAADEPIISNSDGLGQMHDRELPREDINVMESIITSEVTTKPVHRTGKFQPKPNIQMHKEKAICEASGPDSYSKSVPHEISSGEKESISTFQHDDVPELSPPEFPHTLTNEVISEVPLNEGSMNQLDSTIRLPGVPEAPAKLASRRAKSGSSRIDTASGPSPQQQNASPSTEEHVTGRSQRPVRNKTNLRELVEEADDEVLAFGELSEERPLSSAMEVENITDGEAQVESESQTKKVKRKSKKTDDKEKPTRKRKKAKESSDQDTAAKPKRFPHSTRRRRVNKALLEIPEDEIEYEKVQIRDLILLAEHKEKQMKKEMAEAAALTAAARGGETQTTNQSNDNYVEDENFTSNQGGDYDDGEEIPIAEEKEPGYYNYQSYMNKTPTIRWSKQDTELFYEAVGQFGTDFSMIQQLFPDRTRRQVMLKYKKEERQHPMRLREALANRSKDNSHFQMVIERLKQMATEENENADKDDAADLTGNEAADDGNSNADVEEAKDEGIEEVENGEVPNDDSIKDQDPVKSDDEEDDMFLWSQYTSDL